MCETPRPTTGVPTSWNCPSCTFANNMSVAVCAICSGARPEGVVAAAGDAPGLGAADDELLVSSRSSSPVDPTASVMDALRRASEVAEERKAAEVRAAAEARRKTDAAVSKLKGVARGVLARDLLQAAARLAVVANRRASHSNQPAPTPHAPLAVQLHSDTFALLGQLLDWAIEGVVSPAGGGEPSQMLLDVAEVTGQLLGSHLDRLHACRVRFTELGLVQQSVAGTLPAEGVAILASVLRRVLPTEGAAAGAGGAGGAVPPADRTPALSSVYAIAAAVFERGLDLFLPDPDARAQLVADLLQHQTTAHHAPGAPQYALLCGLLHRASQHRTVPTLFPAWMNVKPTFNTAPVESLLRDLLRAASQDLLRVLAPPSGRPSDAPPVLLSAAVSQLLGVFQRQLLSSLASAMEASVDTCPGTPVARTTLVYTKLLAAHCAEVLDAAAARLRRDGADAVGAAVEAALQESVVCGALHAFATALCLFDRELWLAASVLPQLVAVVRRLDTVNGMLPQVLRAEESLQSSEAALQLGEAEHLDRGDVSGALAMRDSSLAGPPLHALLSTEKTLASLCGRMAASMVAGVPEAEEEEFVSSWLKAPSLSGGFDLADAGSDADGAGARGAASHDVVADVFAAAGAGAAASAGAGAGAGASVPGAISALVATEVRAVTAVPSLATLSDVPHYKPFLDRVRADGNLVTPPEWEHAMAEVYAGDVASRDAGAFRSVGTWEALLSDWRGSMPTQYHQRRVRFFERLLAPAVVADKGATMGTLVMQWLQSKVKMSALKRRRLVTYPAVELPVLSVFLRHSGLWKEVEAALGALLVKADATDAPAPPAADPASVPTSAALDLLWKRVCFVRDWLKNQKDAFEMKTWEAHGWTAEDEFDATSASRAVADGSESKGVDTGDVGVRESKLGDDGDDSRSGARLRGNPFAPAAAAPSSGVSESKMDDGSGAGVPPLRRSGSARQKLRRRRRLRPQLPSTFIELQDSLVARAQFLLTTTCTLGDATEEWGAPPPPTAASAPSSGVGPRGGTAVPSQLKDKWSSLLPPATLQPLLTRWQSAPNVESLEALTTDAVDISLDSSMGGGGGGDDEAKDRVTASCKPAAHFICNGHVAHPCVMKELFARRRVRACQRLFGLKAMRALLGSLSLPSAQTDALLFLRPAFRGRVQFLEDMQRLGGAGAALMPDITTIRHHYLKGLEGAPTPLQDRVQAAFIALYTHMCDVMAEAAVACNPAVGHVVMWNWALDFEERDHEFLLRVGILPALRRMMSLRKQPDMFPRLIPAGGGGGGGGSVSPSSTWVLWPAAYVGDALQSGAVTKREVAAHMKAAPLGAVPAEWWLGHHCADGDAKTLAAQHTIASLAELYSQFAQALALDGATVADGATAAVRIQAFARGFLARSSLVRQRSLASVDVDSSTALSVGGAHDRVSLMASEEVRGNLTPAELQFRRSAMALFRLLSTLSMGVTRRSDAGNTAVGAAAAAAGAGAGVAGAGAGAAAGAGAGAGAPSSGDAGAAGANAGDPAEAHARRSTSRFTAALNAESLELVEKELWLGTALLVFETQRRAAALASAAVARSGSVPLSPRERSVAQLGDPTPSSVVSVESLLQSHLTYLYSLYPVTVHAGQALPAPVFRALLALLVVGSPRLQQLAMRMLRDILVTMSPPDADTAFRTEAVRLAAVLPSEARASIVATLLLKVASTLCVTATAAETLGTVAQPCGVGAGRAATASAAEANTLLRVLLGASEAWRVTVTSHLTAALAACRGFVAGDGATGAPARSERARSTIAAAAAAFCVLGAEVDVLRPGTRFALASSDQAARAAASASAAAGASGPSGSAPGSRPSSAAAPGAGAVAGAGAGAGAAPAPPVLARSRSAADEEAARVAARAVVNQALMRVLRPQTAEGTVVTYEHGSKTARVLFDSEGSGGAAVSTSQELTVSAVVPVSEVAPNPAALPMTDDFIGLICAILELNVSGGGGGGDGATPGTKGGGAGAIKCGTKGGASGSTASTELQPVEDVAVWRSQLKSKALQALQILMQHPPSCSAALRAGVLPKLFSTALVPVDLPQFVALRWLSHRATILRERLLDISSGVVLGQEGMTASEGKPTMTEEELRRHANAETLSTMGFEKALCLKALELNRDDADRAAEWLLSGQAEAFVKGGGLDKQPGGDASNSARWTAASDLGPVVAMPPKLCYHALELFNDSMDQATAWLLEHGGMYASLPWIKDFGKSEMIKSDAGDRSATDAAVVDDLDATGPLMYAGEGPSASGGGPLSRGASSISRRMRMAGARGDGGGGGSGVSPLMDVVKSRLMDLLEQEARGTAVVAADAAGSSGGSRWTCDMCTTENAPAAAKCGMCNTAAPARASFERRGETSVPLSRVLVDECVWNVIESTQPGDASETQMHESLHPVFPKCTYHGEVTFEGAKALYVVFDPSCDCSGGQLSFMTDKSGPVVATFTKPDEFKPLVVHSERLYFQFTSRRDEMTDEFGYRFEVSPMRGLQWLNERQVLSDPSLLWACWLLQFMLTEARRLIPSSAVHSPQIMNALIRYLRTPGAPFKHRVISLITQLVKRHDVLGADARPVLHMLTKIQDVVMNEVTRQRASGNVFLPSRLQQLVEMCTVARASERGMRLGLTRRRPVDPATEFKAAGFLGLGSRSKLVRPVQRVPCGVDSAPLADVLLDVYDMAECLHVNARLPDKLTCGATAFAQGTNPADVGRLADKKLEDMVRTNCSWAPQQDEQLVKWLSSVASDKSKSVADLGPADLTMSSRAEMTYPMLKGVPMDALKCRFGTLKLFNVQLARVIDMLDMSNSDQPWSLAYHLRALGHIIFGFTKRRLVEAAIDTTWTPAGSSGMSVTLDNQAAFQSMEAGKSDPSTSKCVFVQAFGALGRCSGAQFRAKLDEKGRLFYVKFRGEDGMDWGGLYRDGATRMVEDLFSTRLNLFVLGSNGVHETGVGSDKFMVNPRHTSPRTLNMYNFVGKLIGISMRQKLYLPFFPLPSLVWKTLVGQPVTMDDVRAVDEASYAEIQSVKAKGAEGPEKFAASYDGYTFTVTGADGMPTELMPGGFDTPLTFDNHQQWVRLAERVSRWPWWCFAVCLVGCVDVLFCFLIYARSTSVWTSTKSKWTPCAGGWPP